MVQFRSIADLHNLSDSEIPGGVVLLDEPWTTDSGLLTPLGKPVRSELAAKFKAKIGILYSYYLAFPNSVPFYCNPNLTFFFFFFFF